MKIVVLGLRGFPNIQGGVETHCEQLYTRVAARGHEVIVIGRKPYMPKPIDTWKGVRLIWMRCPRSTFLEAIVHTFIGTFVAFFLRPDLLHIHAIGPSLLVPMARLLGMTVVTTNHGPDYDRQKWGRASKAILKIGERLGSKGSHRVIAISQPIADHLRKAFNCEATVIPNGVVVRAPAIEHDAVDGLGLTRGHYVIAVGRLVPEKGFHDLVDAFVQADLKDWKLIVIGRADHENAYSLGLGNKARGVSSIVMAGFLSGEPLHQFYSHAGVFVLPSYHEGLPIVLLEAMGYGLPVVVSDIPANRQAGLPDESFFEPGDVARLSARLQAIVVDLPTPAQRRERIEMIRARFDWDTITAKTIEVYETVLENVATRA